MRYSDSSLICTSIKETQVSRIEHDS